MDYTEITSVFGSIGEAIAIALQRIIVWVSNLGIKTTPLQAKIISLIIFATLVFLVIKIITFSKAIIKWIIIILLILLILSIIFSF